MSEDVLIERKAPGLLARIQRLQGYEHGRELRDDGENPHICDTDGPSGEREAEFLYGEDIMDDDEERMILEEMGVRGQLIETIVARSVKHTGRRNACTGYKYEEWGMAGYVNDECAPLEIVTEEAYVCDVLPFSPGRAGSLLPPPPPPPFPPHLTRRMANANRKARTPGKRRKCSCMGVLLYGMIFFFAGVAMLGDVFVCIVFVVVFPLSFLFWMLNDRMGCG